MIDKDKKNTQHASEELEDSMSSIHADSENTTMPLVWTSNFPFWRKQEPIHRVDEV